jgi:pentose-5-phosphate-3-epimerase
MIIPSIIAQTQDEFEERISKISKIGFAHIDVMDGKYVKSKSFSFNCDYSPLFTFDYVEVHLMVREPGYFLEKNLELFEKASKIIVHHDVYFEDVLAWCRQNNKLFSLAVKPDVDVSGIFDLISQHGITECLVMTVDPGFYGSPFKPTTLKTVRKLAELVSVECDGSMTDRTIPLAAKSGAKNFVVGSYLQNSADVIGMYERLVLIAKREVSMYIYSSDS